jgi:hypothetical protein
MSDIVIAVNGTEETTIEACQRRQKDGKMDEYNEITEQLLIDEYDAVETSAGLVTRTSKLKVYFQDNDGELGFNTEILKDQICTKIVDKRKPRIPPKMKEMPAVNFCQVFPSMIGNKDCIQKEHYVNATASYGKLSDTSEFNFTISQDGDGYMCYYNAESLSYKSIQKEGKSMKRIEALTKKLHNLLKVSVLCLHEQNIDNKLIDRLYDIKDIKIRMHINATIFKTACVNVLVD